MFYVDPIHHRSRCCSAHWSPGLPAAATSSTWGASAKAILYFEIVTHLALFLGFGVVNLVRPGDGVPISRTAADAAAPTTPTTLTAVVEHTFPASIIDAMARNDVLQVVVFAFLFGAACAAIGAKAAPVVTFCASLAEVMFRYTST